jgi:hypothetical protein
MYLLFIALILLWVKVSFIRMFMLMGRKNHKDTFADKVMLTPVLVIAYAYNIVARIVQLFRKE